MAAYQSVSHFNVTEKSDLLHARYTATTSSNQESFREQLYLFLEHRNGTFWERVGVIVISSFAGLTALLLVLKSFEHENDSIEIVMTVLDIFFTIEFVARCYSRPTMKSVFTDVMMWNDALAIMPFWVSVFEGQGDPTPEWLDLFMILRVLKAGRFYNGSKIIGAAMSDSIDALCIPIYYFFTLGLVYGTIIFYIERHEEDTAFTDILTCFWFCMVTMTTVGYGDMSPSTMIGKTMTVAMMLSGITSLAMALTIVGNQFSESWDQKNEIILVAKVRQAIKRRQKGSTLDIGEICAAFVSLDQDQSGTLCPQELKLLMVHFDLDQSFMDDKKKMKQLLNFFDEDGSGTISFEEFYAPIFPEREIVQSMYEEYCQLDKEGLIESSARKDIFPDQEKKVTTALLGAHAENDTVGLLKMATAEIKALRDSHEMLAGRMNAMAKERKELMNMVQAMSQNVRSLMPASNN